MGKLPPGTEKLHLFKWNKLPVMLQAEAAEYGFPCLAMVAGYHGYNAQAFR
ncbi:MAG: hypothetical protein L3J05_01350 [Robiginitomaculum sp.]|nr:hypothetical protein [Robiginitomaculum sp.]